MKVACIVPAAGRGSRIGKSATKREKPYLSLNGKPILAHTLLALENCRVIDEIIVVVSETGRSECRSGVVDRYGLKKVKKITLGGPTRSDSVYNGLKEVGGTFDLVLIHDGSRPFVTEDMVNRVVGEAATSGACILATRVVPTIKEVNKELNVVRTLERDRLWMVQTPQAFKIDLILKAYELAGKDRSRALDDSTLVERIGHHVKVLEGSPSNIKITTSEDIVVAEMLLKQKF